MTISHFTSCGIEGLLTSSAGTGNFNNLVVNNGNFLLLLTSSGQGIFQKFHWTISLLTSSNGQVVNNGNFTLLLTSSGQ